MAVGLSVNGHGKTLKMMAHYYQLIAVKYEEFERLQKDHHAHFGSVNFMNQILDECGPIIKTIQKTKTQAEEAEEYERELHRNMLIQVGYSTECSRYRCTIPWSIRARSQTHS